jgi:Cysteine-rich secretory protein family
MNLLKRILSVAFSGLLAFGALAGVAVLGSSVARADVVLDEARFVQRMNADRASIGAPPLIVSARLVEIARSWSQLLGARSTSLTECLLSHNQNLLELLRPASKVAENVGCGDADADALHNAFMNSPHHRSNILDPSFDSVGVGVFMSGDTMFVSVEFIRTVASVAPFAAVAPTLVPLPNLVPVPATVPAAKLVPAKAGAAPRAATGKPKVPTARTAPSAKVAPKSPPKKSANSKLSSGSPKLLSKASNASVLLAKKGMTYAFRAKRISRLFRAENKP